MCVRDQAKGNVMEADTERRIAALLRETGSAHGAYEQRALGGARDEAWAAWYAEYLVEHGLADLLGQPLTVTGTRDLLIGCDEAYRATQSTADWPEAYAARFVAMSA